MRGSLACERSNNFLSLQSFGHEHLGSSRQPPDKAELLKTARQFSEQRRGKKDLSHQHQQAGDEDESRLSIQR